MNATAETSFTRETPGVRSFGAALWGFLGSTAATTLVLVLLAQV